ncbi:hypothetical protein HMPREF0993_00300 [Lachnospiraceae bacterium 5_1_57FAA]|nr:hypothetical protein HMPREF0993_00300 [Lachnospiraceae bacterium 5_1_57FAA]
MKQSLRLHRLLVWNKMNMVNIHIVIIQLCSECMEFMSRGTSGAAIYLNFFFHF